MVNSTTNPAPGPLVVLAGKDAYLRQEYRQQVIATALGDADPQLAVAILDADTPWADVLDELQSLPFLAPHRVVIIREADAFVTENRDPLETYFQKPVPTATLVLEVSQWRKNTKLARMLPEAGGVLRECSSPQGAALVDWVCGQVRDGGKAIHRDAAELLVQWVGEDQAALSNEIQKLLLYALEDDTITVQHISAITSGSAPAEAFGLANALIRGDTRSALQELSRSLTSRGAEFQILGQIAWHVRRAVQVQQQIAAGTPPASAMRSAKVVRFLQGAFSAMLKRRPAQTMQRDMRRVMQADLSMKSGRDARGVLEELVVALSSPEA